MCSSNFLEELYKKAISQIESMGEEAAFSWEDGDNPLFREYLTHAMLKGSKDDLWNKVKISNSELNNFINSNQMKISHVIALIKYFRDIDICISERSNRAYNPDSSDPWDELPRENLDDIQEKLRKVFKGTDINEYVECLQSMSKLCNSIQNCDVRRINCLGVVSSEKILPAFDATREIICIVKGISPPELTSETVFRAITNTYAPALDCREEIELCISSNRGPKEITIKSASMVLIAVANYILSVFKEHGLINDTPLRTSSFLDNQYTP